MLSSRVLSFLVCVLLSVHVSAAICNESVVCTCSGAYVRDEIGNDESLLVCLSDYQSTCISSMIAV